MSKVKLLSGPRDVPLLGRVVEEGEVVEVPDTQPDGSPIIWPETTWEPVADKPGKTVKVTSDPAAGK